MGADWGILAAGLNHRGTEPQRRRGTEEDRAGRGYWEGTGCLAALVLLTA